jgi:dephospho-CoA kinase
MANNYIALVSTSSAGKGVVATMIQQLLAGKKTVSIHRYSDSMSFICQYLGQPNTKSALQKMSQCLRQHVFNDEALLGKAIRMRADESTADVVVLDGARRLEDLEHFKDIPMTVIAIDAPVEKRWEWQRNRTDRPHDKNDSFEAFVAREQFESETQIATLATTAGFHINNNGTLEHLKNQVHSVLLAMEL